MTSPVSWSSRSFSILRRSVCVTNDSRRVSDVWALLSALKYRLGLLRLAAYHNIKADLPELGTPTIITSSPLRRHTPALVRRQSAGTPGGGSAAAALRRLLLAVSISYFATCTGLPAERCRSRRRCTSGRCSCPRRPARASWDRVCMKGRVLHWPGARLV